MSTLRCLLCFKGHIFSKCPEFQDMNIYDRWKSVKRLNLCFGCLGKNHALSDCRKLRKCGIDNCVKFHHSMLHKTEIRQQKIVSNRPESQKLENRIKPSVNEESVDFVEC